MKITLYRNTLNEGIDIDTYKRIVTYNPSHSNFVDTSLKFNPNINKNIFKSNLSALDKVAFTKGEFNNITVWSIFKRFGNRTTYDGNPLIYALKEENGWKFPNTANKEQFFEQVELVIKKFLTMNKPDTIIVIPSSNPLNNKLAEMIVENSPESEIINDVLIKITAESILNYVYEPDSAFREFYGESFQKKYRELEEYINKNVRVKHLNSDLILFKRHWIEDSTMRTVIDKTMMLNDVSYADLINNKNILLVDDIISHCSSNKESIRTLKDQYEPKKIDVLTLLSKRY